MALAEEDKSFDSQPSSNILDESSNSISELEPSPVSKLTLEEHQKFLEFKEILNEKGITKVKDDFIIRNLIATKYLYSLTLDIILKRLLNLLC